MSQPEIRSHADAPAAAAAAAAYIAAAARAAVGERGRFSLALSGGRTPAQMLTALAGETLREALPWDALQVFQVDERVAPAGDPARNLNMVRDGLVRAGLLAADNLHAMPVEDVDLAAAADAYAATLARVAGEPAVLDLVHLGLGDDGHTASLVPGDDGLDITDRAVHVTGDYRGHRRMTLTFPVLNRARCRLWLCTGEDKGPMLARLHAGDEGIPAGRVAREHAVVFCDVAAARAAGLAA